MAARLRAWRLPAWILHLIYGKKFVNNIPKDATQAEVEYVLTGRLSVMTQEFPSTQGSFSSPAGASGPSRAPPPPGPVWKSVDHH